LIDFENDGAVDVRDFKVAAGDVEDFSDNCKIYLMRNTIVRAYDRNRRGKLCIWGWSGSWCFRHDQCWEKVYKLKTQITRPHSKEKEQKLKEQRLEDKRRKIPREKISSYNLILAFLFLACLSLLFS
jgi:hypothetical protein